MNKKLRVGIKNPGALLPNIGIFTPTVPERVGEIMIGGFDAMKFGLKAAGYPEWANRLVCEWR